MQTGPGPTGTAAVATITQGYTSVDSVTAGTNADLYVSTPARSYRIEAYRMGYFGPGMPQACQVWRSARVTGGVQHAPVIVGSVHEPTAPWRRSLTIATTGWEPGVYLLRIDGGTKQGRAFMPLVVRSPSFSGRVVLLMPDTTWQAYNGWGGHSLYYAPNHNYQNRARIVPFNRPYATGGGAAQFPADQLPLLTLAQRIGIPLAYATDVDLERDPSAFKQARAVISVGHDEYYSPKMRETLTTARDSGVNLAFLGANAIYRKIRFTSTALGANRAIINYKDRTDPIRVPSLVTTQWPEHPSNDPESSLTGNGYQCATRTYAPLVVADAGNWMFAGTKVTTGLNPDPPFWVGCGVWK